MRTFTLQQSNAEECTPKGGLALVGHCLNRHTPRTKTARRVFKRHGIPNIDLIRIYLGLIRLGKSDFEAFESVRTDPHSPSQPWVSSVHRPRPPCVSGLMKTPKR